MLNDFPPFDSMVWSESNSNSGLNSSVPAPHVGSAATAFENAAFTKQILRACDDLTTERCGHAITELQRLWQTALKRGDAELAEVACHNLAVAFRQVGDFSAARSWQQQSIAWWTCRAASVHSRDREDDELARLACDLTGRGCDEFIRRDFALAESFWRRALAIEEWRGSWDGQAVDCGNLGLLAAARGEFSDGIRWLRKSLQWHLLLSDQSGAGMDLMNLAELQRLLGEFRRSTNSLRCAVRCFRHVGAVGLQQQAELRLHEARRIEAVLQFDPQLN